MAAPGRVAACVHACQFLVEEGAGTRTIMLALTMGTLALILAAWFICAFLLDDAPPDQEEKSPGRRRRRFRRWYRLVHRIPTPRRGRPRSRGAAPGAASPSRLRRGRAAVGRGLRRVGSSLRRRGSRPERQAARWLLGSAPVPAADDRRRAVDAVLVASWKALADEDRDDARGLDLVTGALATALARIGE